ncbi:MAG: aldolase/citrate lyase family protein [Lachnospiraceae bacterium]|nr:aldolase/citrate lyase family protein [Lachnospiraceae bacterium]
MIGTHIRSQDPCMTELLAALGYDMVWIENEHSNLDRYQTTLHIIAAQARGAAAIVRLPWNDPVLAKPILELGVDGVVFPMINSEEEARRAVASCTYPPKGIRGMGPIRSNNYGLISNEEYIRGADDQIFKIMQIEHRDGVKNIDKILEVEGVDGIVVGQFDLSASLGLLPDVYHEENLSCIRSVFNACKRHGKICGISSEPRTEIVQMYLDMGVDFIFMCYEYDWVRMGAGNALHTMRELGKENGR